MTDPFDDWADTYRSRGWTGTLPLPLGQKAAPPGGYTGELGRMPETAEIAEWRTGGAHNIAIRLPRNVIGLDVDAYGDKRGLTTFVECVQRAGPLPATYVSSSRPDSPVSGIRLFRLPQGVSSTYFRDPGHVGPDLEVIRFGHRYIVAAPSIHPSGGEYAWRAPDGTRLEPEDLPPVGALPELPLAWCDLLGGERPETHAGDTFDLGGESRHTDIARPITSGHDNELSAFAASVVAKYSATVPYEGLYAMILGRGQFCVPPWDQGMRPGDDTLAVRAHIWLRSALTKYGKPYVEPETDPETGELLPDESCRPLDWHALWSDETEDKWLCEPLIAAGRGTVLYSPAKTGKSLITLEIIANLACGRDALGFRPDRPIRTLVLDHENDPRSDTRDRLKRMGFKPDDLDNLIVLSYPVMPTLDTQEGGMRVLELARRHDAELVVIDTVSRAVAGEENDNNTWLQFYRHTGLALKRAGIAMLRLDHSGKDVAKGQRGGSAKTSDVDLVWALSEVVPDKTYLLTCTHNRMMVAERAITLHRESMPLRHVVDAMGRGAAHQAAVREIILCADAAGLPDDASYAEYAAACKAAGVQGGSNKREGSPLRHAKEDRAKRLETTSPGAVTGEKPDSADLRKHSSVTGNQTRKSIGCGLVTKVSPVAGLMVNKETGEIL